MIKVCMKNINNKLKTQTSRNPLHSRAYPSPVSGDHELGVLCDVMSGVALSLLSALIIAMAYYIQVTARL